LFKRSVLATLIAQRQRKLLAEVEACQKRENKKAKKSQVDTHRSHSIGSWTMR